MDGRGSEMILRVEGVNMEVFQVHLFVQSLFIDGWIRYWLKR